MSRTEYDAEHYRSTVNGLSANLDPELRAERLTVAEFATLADAKRL